jgi:hypothetical protein
MRRFGELPDIDIRMIATTYIVVLRLQESWEIVLPMLLTAPFHSTIETAAMLAMIAHKPGDMHHTWSIGSNQHEEDLGSHFALKLSVPDPKPLLLKCDQMLKPREQERIQILGVIWAWDEAADKNVVLLVAQCGREIQKDPYVDPTGRELFSIQLGSIDREYQYDVISSDEAIIECLHKICAMEDIRIFIKISLAL